MINALAASLGLSPSDPSFWMPLTLVAILFLLIVAGTVLDGFDLGVGLVLPLAPPAERGRMMMLLNPWRDANQFWLFLGIGLFLAAFPFAWGAVMGQLYAPLTLMTGGVVLRSVSFEFRIRARTESKPRWVVGFWLGSVMTAFGQGAALGRIVTGFQTVAGYGWFAVFVGACAVATYIMLGSSWLVMRVRGDLQRRAAVWARHAVRWTAAGMVAIAVTLGLANAGIFYKWSNLSHLSIAVTVWVIMLGCFVCMEMILSRVPGRGQRYALFPFLLSCVLLAVMLGALAFSLFPYLVLDDLTIWDGAAGNSSLRLLMLGVGASVPVAIVFNVLAYRSFLGQEKITPR